MDSSSTTIKLAIGSLVMILLQLFLAPIISINSVAPNFLLAFAIASIAARPDQNHLVFAFFMGLIYDILCKGPVGSLAFVMVVVSFLASLILARIKHINFSISLIVIVVSIFIAELLYGIFQVSLFVDSTFVDMIAYRVLPCTVYDSIIAVILFPLMVKAISPTDRFGSYNDEINNNRW